ncbi:MAG: hypothetical protein FJX45_19250 [Alphaproteobacteria bacterium]|nr:hypothetical protein [Alphaproteobacteria bacterium]MBM3654575.1 hypothetical protein [Alphaproteobacteria bacterium]
MTAQSNASRRLFLAAGSASAVFGALAQAAATSSPGDDPIFAVIARHKAAEARFSAACGLTDDVAAREERRAITKQDRAEFDAAERELDAAWDSFVVTSPTSIAGLRAFLQHCVDQDSAGPTAEALEVLLTSPVLAISH